jgi:hypothetical protein
MSLSRNFKKPARFAFPQLRIASLLIVFFLAAAADLAAAQVEALRRSARRSKLLVSKFMASTHVPGVSVAIVENSEYEWGGGFGLADVENNSPASEHTLFRLASISKSLPRARNTTLGARASRSRRPCPEILPGISAEAVADHHTPDDGTPGRHPSLQNRPG